MRDDPSNPESNSDISTLSYERIEIVELNPGYVLRDYRDAMHVANRVADCKLGSYMMHSWHDRDRNFGSPQHADERFRH